MPHSCRPSITHDCLLLQSLPLPCEEIVEGTEASVISALLVDWTLNGKRPFRDFFSRPDSSLINQDRILRLNERVVIPPAFRPITLADLHLENLGVEK
nr:unnamed protein product [Fasciola hepatica]